MGLDLSVAGTVSSSRGWNSPYKRVEILVVVLVILVVVLVEGGLLYKKFPS